jgi:uncharacterized membrane protein
VLALALASCGVDPTSTAPPPPSDTTCAQSILTYQNFGEPFLANWCRGCHSSGLPADMRQDAPMDSNFDTLDEVHVWSETIATRAGGAPPSMPPAGGPSDSERALLVEWLGCGAK